jgi:CheY-like chemotaxis protein
MATIANAIDKRTHYQVCLLGFSPEQTAAIGVYCRFASRRNLAWSVTSQPEGADGILVNAANPLEFEQYKADMAAAGKVVVVGASSYGSAWQHLPSPLSLADAQVAFNYFLAHPAAATVADAASAAAPAAVPVPPPAAEAAVLPELPATAPAASAAAPAAAPSKKSLQVLIVANNDATLKQLQGQIEHFGHSCQLAYDGEEALVLVAGQPFQFVFLDANIAGLDCFQTCRAIKQNKAANRAAPAVVLLANPIGAMDKIRAGMAGCDAHVVKPLDDGQLAALLAGKPLSPK